MAERKSTEVVVFNSKSMVTFDVSGDKLPKKVSFFRQLLLKISNKKLPAHAHTTISSGVSSKFFLRSSIVAPVTLSVLLQSSSVLTMYLYFKICAYN